MRIWVDTDIGSDVDDALTLAYVMRQPGFELVGVSTVFGDVDLRSEIARSLLGVAQASDVPVVTGLGVPISPGRHGLMFGQRTPNRRSISCSTLVWSNTCCNTRALGPERGRRRVE